MIDMKDTHETLKPGTHVEVLTKKQLMEKLFVARLSAPPQTHPVLISWSTIPAWITDIILKTNCRSFPNRFARSTPRPF
jgi:hypothetical protein